MVEDEKLWGRYERLRPGQIEAIRRRCAIAYIPWGALEWHSYHNPIGLDGLVAQGLCEAVAARTGGLVLPPVYFATSTIKTLKGFGHTIENSEGLIRQMASELLAQLVEEQFRVIVLLTGHCGQPHYDILLQAGRECAARHGGVKVIALTETDRLEGLAEKNHAARGETSLQLYFAPELVDLSLLPGERPANLEDDGVWGEDPRGATALEGEKLTRAFVDRFAPEIEALWTEVSL